jgi:membrane dipeptidase
MSIHHKQGGKNVKTIDLHCDTMLRIVDRGNEIGLRSNDLNVDIEKLNAGNVVAQFFALFIDLAKTDNPLQYCLTMLDRFHQELAENQTYIRLATSYSELCRNEAEGKISAFLTIEEGGALKGSLANLRNFYRLGVRLITLTWNYPNEIGFPNAIEDCRAKGLTEFGREVVAEMNRLGMLIDVSHLSDQGFYDVASLSKQPFVASHSNARAITGHPRNLTDDMIRILAERGGVTGLTFAKQFLGDKDISLVEDMVLHVKHLHQVGGIDVIALGTDFDGTKPKLEVANSGEMSKLWRGLAEAGFSESEIEKMRYGNAVRVIREVMG